MAYLGASGNISNIQKLDSITFDSVTNSFPMNVGGNLVSIPSPLGLIISVGGVIQEPYVDYVVTGSNLIFTTAPLTGLPFFGVALGKSIDIGTVPDGSITNVKIGETISIAKGGTGATTADNALISLGGGAAGIAVFKSATQAIARAQLSLGSAALLTAGTGANNVVQLDGTGKLPAIDGSNLTGLSTGPVGNIVGVKTFFTSGTYTPTSGTTKILIEAQGGGGNGGAGGSFPISVGGAGGGGGGGGAAPVVRTLIANNTSQTVTIGGGGSATTLGSIFTAPAGTNGNNGNSGSGGIGGTGGGGAAAPSQMNNTIYTNGTGGGGFGGGDGGFGTGGAGGAGGGGGGAGGGGGTTNVSAGGGSSGSVRGSGGGGGGGGGNGNAGASLSGAGGGAGGPGYMIIYEFA